MKKIIVGLVFAVGVIGLFSLVAVAKNEKVVVQSNVSGDKIKKKTVQSIQNNQSVVENKNIERIKINNAGQDANLKNTVGNKDKFMNGTEAGIGKGNLKIKNSDELKDSAEKVVKGLKSIVAKETKIGEKLVKLADEQDEIQDEVIEAVEKIEKQRQVKSFLIGTDYDSLGQLRSSMVKNVNQIRQLTRLIGQVEDGENKLVLQEQLNSMMQERDGINALIKEEEESFSLFGWAFKLINNYSSDSIDEVVEAELKVEVEEALKVVEIEEEVPEIISN